MCHVYLNSQHFLLAAFISHFTGNTVLTYLNLLNDIPEGGVDMMKSVGFYDKHIEILKVCQ